MSSEKRRRKYHGESVAKSHPEPRPMNPKSRKNTRDWCRGKVGVTHQPIVTGNRGRWNATCQRSQDWEMELFGNRPWRCVHQTVCTSCGKVLARVPWQECPDVPAVFLAIA